MSEGLEQVAGQTRGSMSVVNGDGQIAFDRLGRELSGYYLLGFEPTECGSHRTRAAHQGRGEDARPHGPRAADLRDSAAADKETPASLTPMQQLGEVLKSPLPVRGLPMRVASYTAIESGGSKVRVVITAEVGDPASAPADWPIGVVVLDKNDKIVVNRGGVSTLAPASKGAETPRLLLTSIALDPGEYTLRIAVVNP